VNFPPVGPNGRFQQNARVNDCKEWRYGIVGLIEAKGDLSVANSTHRPRVLWVVMAEIGGEGFPRWGQMGDFDRMSR